MGKGAWRQLWQTGAHMMEEETWLSQVVLWQLYVHYDTQMFTHKINKHKMI